MRGILKQEPCPLCNHFQGALVLGYSADLIALYNHFADTETALQRAKQTINRLASFALWLQGSRITFCLLAQLWPSQWFWWTRINVSWHISLLVTDPNNLTLLNFLSWGTGQACHEPNWTNRVDAHMYMTAQLPRSQTFLWSVFSCQISLRYCHTVRGIRIFVISPED